MAAPISRILASAIGPWASYSRNFTRRPPVWSRTTPENRASAPAPGCSTAWATARSDRGSVVTSIQSGPGSAAPPLTGGNRQSSSPSPSG